MLVYGLREARALIAAERKALAADHPRATDPYTRGQRDALKEIDRQLKVRIAELTTTPEPAA